MPDVFTKAKRSEVMSRIHGRGNKETELALARLLRRHRVKGWRRHSQIVAAVYDRRHSSGAHRAPLQYRNFSVRPDFVFRQVRLALFVDGCFWHSCPKHKTNPKNNRAFWRRKLSGNKERDQLVNRTLRESGWRVIRIWECALQKRPQSCVRRILQALS